MPDCAKGKLNHNIYMQNHHLLQTTTTGVPRLWERLLQNICYPLQQHAV